MTLNFTYFQFNCLSYITNPVTLSTLWLLKPFLFGWNHFNAIILVFTTIDSEESSINIDTNDRKLAKAIESGVKIEGEFEVFKGNVEGEEEGMLWGIFHQVLGVF